MMEQQEISLEQKLDGAMVSLASAREQIITLNDLCVDKGSQTLMAQAQVRALQEQVSDLQVRLGEALRVDEPLEGEEHPSEIEGQTALTLVDVIPDEPTE